MSAIGFIDPSTLRGSRWVLAALTIVLLHAGALALAIVGMPEEEIVDETEGSVMMELAPLPVSAAREGPEMPPAPPIEEARGTAKAGEEGKPEEGLPGVEPAPAAPQAEVAPPTIKPVEEP